MGTPSIQRATRSLAKSIDWIRTDGQEWTFVGLSQEFSEAAVQGRVDRFFPEERLYLVFGGRDSAEVPRAQAAHLVKELLLVREVSLWDTGLRRTLQFNRMGLCKAGMVRSK
ncbi:hypothetical protein [Mesoterricola silvestris]|uniref:Uncharacterized protein n=1 Tax=Mesoterricola silvestris TaxID=2927979 RepID=A0AA48GPF1_9BACT|nr:hypothetical protein [Mesoterricola silvestris]BDU73270.1 hypothetical protein METEAL_24440 [Mesoterricola silvestris]